MNVMLAETTLICHLPIQLLYYKVWQLIIIPPERLRRCLDELLVNASTLYSVFALLDVETKASCLNNIFDAFGASI